MNQPHRPDAEAIRRARADNPKMRERDLARQLNISEAELVAAHVGESAIRIEARVDDLLEGLEAVGEVMALTRNEGAVHEKIGIYENISVGKHNALVLGEQIDLRIFPNAWKYGFSVEKRDGDDIRRSLQFFDAAGDAVHKIHLRRSSNLYAFQQLVDRLAAADQSQAIGIAHAVEDDETAQPAPANLGELRERWSRMTDVHQFFGILRALRMTRHQAISSVGEDFAWALDNGSLHDMMSRAAGSGMPIMCFVGSRGCIQIHSGPIEKLQAMGPWLNVIDPTFHLHLRLDQVREVWAVRKPTAEGHVTSLEAYGADRKLIIQFFGKRKEGEDERADWRGLVETLSRAPQSSAA